MIQQPSATQRLPQVKNNNKKKTDLQVEYMEVEVSCIIDKGKSTAELQVDKDRNKLHQEELAGWQPSAWTWVWSPKPTQGRVVPSGAQITSVGGVGVPLAEASFSLQRAQVWILAWGPLLWEG